MKQPVLCVKDRALDSYNAPWTQTTTAQAVRSFTDEINTDPERSQVAKHPDDYDLYIVGYFENDTGILEPLERPQLVVRGKDLIRPKGE